MDQENGPQGQNEREALRYCLTLFQAANAHQGLSMEDCARAETMIREALRVPQGGLDPLHPDIVAVEQYIDGYGHGHTLDDYRRAKRRAREALHRLAARLRPGDGSAPAPREWTITIPGRPGIEPSETVRVREVPAPNGGEG